jgi:hypothetical protein
VITKAIAGRASQAKRYKATPKGPSMITFGSTDGLHPPPFQIHASTLKGAHGISAVVSVQRKRPLTIKHVYLERSQLNTLKESKP